MSHAQNLSSVPAMMPTVSTVPLFNGFSVNPTDGDWYLYSWRDEQSHRSSERTEICYLNSGTCPECENGIVHQGGCEFCPGCGWSACG